MFNSEDVKSILKPVLFLLIIAGLGVLGLGYVIGYFVLN